jgi:hypothetical protein
MIPGQEFWDEWRIEKGQILTRFKLDVAFFIQVFTPPGTFCRMRRRSVQQKWARAIAGGY